MRQITLCLLFLFAASSLFCSVAVAKAPEITKTEKGMFAPHQSSRGSERSQGCPNQARTAAIS